MKLRDNIRELVLGCLGLVLVVLPLVAWLILYAFWNWFSFKASAVWAALKSQPEKRPWL